MANFTISVKTNVDLPTLANRIEQAAHPTVGDLLYAGQRQRTRILDRTSRGVDVNETAFAPYSTNGPFYYYPNTTGSLAQRKSAATRFAKKIGIDKGQVAVALNASKGSTMNMDKMFRKAFAGHHQATRTLTGIKFSSYAAFKIFLGRGGLVDLRGPKAPHMLQALLLKVGGITLFDSEGFREIKTDTGETPGFSNETPASEIIIGIYGPEADRAEGHQQGRAHLPKRKFIGANELDKELMLDDIVRRMGFRMKQAIKGGGQ